MAHTYRITYSGFLLLSFALSAATWYHVRTTFDVVTMADVGLSAFLTVCSLALFILALLLFTVRETFGVFALFCAGFLLFLPFHAQYLLGVLLSFLVFVYAGAWMRRSIADRLTVSFYSLLLYGVPSLLTALALLYASAGYFYPVNLTNARISSGAFTWAVPLMDRFASARFPYYRPGMTVDEFFSAGAESAAKAQLGQVSQQAQQLIGREAAKQRDELGKQFGVSLTGNETIGDLFASVSNAYLGRFMPSYEAFVPIVVALSVFLSIKSFGFLLNRLALALAWLVSRLLTASGVIIKQKIATEREALTLSS